MPRWLGERRFSALVVAKAEEWRSKGNDSRQGPSTVRHEEAVTARLQQAVTVRTWHEHEARIEYAGRQRQCCEDEAQSRSMCSAWSIIIRVCKEVGRRTISLESGVECIEAFSQSRPFLRSPRSAIYGATVPGLQYYSSQETHRHSMSIEHHVYLFPNALAISKISFFMQTT